MVPQTLDMIYFTHANVHIAIYEEWHKLLLNDRSIPLTPTEYRLCAAFLQQWQSEHREMIINDNQFIVLSYLTMTDLQMRTALASKQLLRKHISNANSKLAPFNIHIKAFEKGYIFLITTQQHSTSKAYT